MLYTIKILWASPNTLVGLALGVLGVMTGGHVQRHTGVLEFYGGGLAWLFEQMGDPHVIAMTLGHVVLGHSYTAIEFSRQHERVHVRQYEAWGPLFLPAYAVGSLLAWAAGKRIYRDNFFEREAYAQDDLRRDPPSDDNPS